MAETLLKRLRNSQFLKDIWTNLVSNAIWKLLAILATPILIWFGFSKGGLGDGPNNGTTTVTQTVPAPSDKTSPAQTVRHLPLPSLSAVNLNKIVP